MFAMVTQSTLFYSGKLVHVMLPCGGNDVRYNVFKGRLMLCLYLVLCLYVLV